MDNWIILMVRTDSRGYRNVWAMTKSEDDETLATFDSLDEASNRCDEHIMAKSSRCLLVDIDTHETIEYEP